MQPLSLERVILGCRFQLFGLYLPSKQSHSCGNQQKLRTLQESVTPVQLFAAETLFSGPVARIFARGVTWVCDVYASKTRGGGGYF